jgi:hypothetical protein
MVRCGVNIVKRNQGDYRVRYNSPGAVGAEIQSHDIQSACHRNMMGWNNDEKGCDEDDAVVMTLIVKSV